jgi:cell division protein FtsQ
MTSSIASTSRTELTQRRKKLRHQRRLRLLQAGWRLLAIASLAVGSVWATTLPIWVLRQPEQVKVEGNQFIPTQTIRGLLPLSYPQSLFRVEPQEIARSLKEKAPISEVTVRRQLFPPGLLVQVKERYPVAIAFLTQADMQAAQTRSQLASGEMQSRVGMLDEAGKWIRLERYITLDQSLKLPVLRVIGKPESYQRFWSQLYRDVNRSPVRIIEINLQDPANLILRTELGLVYFGPYDSRFPDQLKILDRMRRLPARFGANQLVYIDLRDLQTPMVQLNSSTKPIKSSEL